MTQPPRLFSFMGGDGAMPLKATGSCVHTGCSVTVSSKSRRTVALTVEQSACCPANLD